MSELPATPDVAFSSLAPMRLRLRNLREDIVLSVERLYPSGSGLHICDHVVIGVLNRTADLLDGILLLTDNWNFVAAVPLVRLLVDSLIRLMYLESRPDRDTLAKKVLAGTSFRELRDTDKAKLTDRRLVDLAARRYRWVSEVYAQTTDFVHLSHRVCFQPFSPLDENDDCHMWVGGSGRTWPEDAIDALYEMAIGCAKATLETAYLVRGMPLPPIDTPGGDEQRT